MIMHYPYKGALLVLLSALGFSLLPIFAIFAYRGGISITTLLLIRFSLAAVAFFIYVFAKFKRLDVSKKDLFFLFILGGICYNLQARCYFSAVKYIPSSLAALFLYTYPIIVTMLSFIIDKEKITGKIMISIMISFTGLVMILGASLGKINGIGILLAFGAALIYSVYIMIGNRVVKKIPPLVASSFVTLFSAIGVLIPGLLSGEINFHFETGTWFPIIGLVLCSTILAILFFFRGIELLGPAKASIISMMEPVFTVVFSTLLLSDKSTVIQLIGGATVLTGAILVIRLRQQTQ
jgi:drug/metabolite transporter (DMT)-like permease